MDASRRQELLFNLSGVATWIMVAGLRLGGLRQVPVLGPRGLAWWVCTAVGGALFAWVVFGPRLAGRPLVVVCCACAAALPWLDPMKGMAFIPFSATVVLLVHAFGWRAAAVASLVETVALALVDVSFLFFGLLCLTFILSTTQAIAAERHRRDMDAAHAELVAANERLREAQAALARATRDEERVRIARDLHDVIGHQLTGLTLQLEVASHLTTGDAADAVGRARAAAKGLLADVRGVVDRLRDQHSDLADELADMTAAVPRPRVELVTEGDLAAVDDARAEVVLRCVQEGLTNAVRHARAVSMQVTVARTPEGRVRVAMADDGGAPHGPVTPGNGLTGMRERVEGVGGRLEYGPGERGFRIDIELPGGQA